ncbi:MAG: tetratricopeptide repeat protein [Chloroflexi bacterium]|nr:tetratricopeptide repeat protein [Chloroflexota bacterium]
MIEMQASEFVMRLRGKMEDPECRFTFFLGAGCSVSSGIPAAGTLVKSWLPRLKMFKTRSEDNLDEWVKKEFPDYAPENAALSYAPVFKQLFDSEQEQQREIEKLVEEKDPGFGYGVLAQIMSHERCGRHCNFVLTTNFDNLVADALYLYTSKKPLVILHESLIGFVRLTRTSPLVIKLHGDALLAPRSTAEQTRVLDPDVEEVLIRLLRETGLVFIGYGGNDRSIAAMLHKLPRDSLPLGIYWVSSSVPNNDMGGWLESRHATWVQHHDFDELMLLVRNEFELEKHPDFKRFEKLEKTYSETFKSLSDKVAAKPESAEKRTLEKAVEQAAREFTSWIGVWLEASRYEKTDPERADQIYQEGLKKFPQSADLLGVYAGFLKTVRKDYGGAEGYYQRALEADPGYATALGNYANFLWTIRKDYEGAEGYYRRAIEADPGHATALGNYALFLWTIRKDYEGAEGYYKRALEADPGSAIKLGNYAGLLLARGDYDKGLSMLDKALSLAGPDEQALLLECFFYRYAHHRDEDIRNKSLARIKEMIEAGVRSPGWNLQDNVERGVKDGHPYPGLLQTLARVIADEAEAQELEGFDVWRKAGREDG